MIVHAVRCKCKCQQTCTLLFAVAAAAAAYSTNARIIIILFDTFCIRLYAILANSCFFFCINFAQHISKNFSETQLFLGVFAIFYAHFVSVPFLLIPYAFFIVCLQTLYKYLNQLMTYSFGIFLLIPRRTISKRYRGDGWCNRNVYLESNFRISIQLRRLHKITITYEMKCILAARHILPIPIQFRLNCTIF